MSDFSIIDIYDEALKRLQAQRTQAGQASNAAYEKLAKNTQAAYEALDREAAVNKALNERAYGTVGDRIVTLAQRRDTNYRNTVGDNVRARDRALDTVELERGNAEVRLAADETASSATFAAMRDEALVSQERFDKELGLRQKELDLQQQNNRFSQAYQMLVGGMMDEKGFEGVTGIGVRKPPKKVARPAVIAVGEEAPETNTEGYVTESVRLRGGTVLYYEVREDLVAPMKAAGIKPYNKNGGAKCEAQIYAELHYEGFLNASPEEQLAILEENKEDFTKRFGPNYYTLYYGYLELFGELTELGLLELAPLEDILRNFNYYAGKDEMQIVFDQYNAACTAAVKAISEKYPDSVSWELVKEYYPEIAAQFGYSNSSEDKEREWLGIAPASFTSEAFAAALEETWGIDGPTDTELFMDTPYRSHDDMERMQRGQILEHLGVDLSTLSLIELMALAIYLDSSVFNNSDNETTTTSNGDYYSVLSYGESLYQYYATKDMVISRAESLPASIRVLYIFNIPNANTVSLSAQDLAYAEELWNSLSEEERYNLAVKMINDNSEYFETQQRKKFENKMIKHGQAYALDNGFTITDEQAYMIEGSIYYYNNLDQTPIYEAAVEWAKSKYGESYESIPATVIITYQVRTWGDGMISGGASGGGTQYEYINTSWNATTLLLDNPDNDTTVKYINDQISYTAWVIAMGGTASIETIAELREYGLDDIADILETRSAYNEFIIQGDTPQQAEEKTGWNGNNYFELTETAEDRARKKLYQDAEDNKLEADRVAQTTAIQAIIQADPDYARKVKAGQVVEDEMPLLLELMVKTSYTTLSPSMDALKPLSDTDFMREINRIYQVLTSDDPEDAEERALYEENYSRLTIDDIEALQYLWTVRTETGDNTGFREYRTLVESVYNEETYQLDLEKTEIKVKEAGIEGEIEAAVTSIVYSFYSWPAYLETLVYAIKGERVDPSSRTQIMARTVSDYGSLATSTTSGFKKWALEVTINIFQNLPYFALGNVAGPILMGLNAAGQTAAQMNVRGYSAWESFGYGTVVGTIEAATEAMAFKGVEVFGKNLINSAPLAGSLLKWAQKMVAGGAIKMTPQMIQEATAAIVENILDVAVLGEDSDYAAILRQHLLEGMTLREAQLATFTDQFIWSPLYQASVAFGTGLGMAIIATVKQTKSHEYRINAIERRLQGELTEKARTLLEGMKRGLQQELVQMQNEELAKKGRKGRRAEALPTKETQGEQSLSQEYAKAETKPQVTEAVGNTAQEMQALSDQTGLNLYNDAVNNAYLQFGQNPTNGNAMGVYNAALESLGNAIAQQQAGTILLTESQVNAINTQIDSISTRVSELVSQGQTQAGVTTQTNPTATQRAMVDTISTLLKLPADAQTQANVEAARQAYYDYISAGEGGKAAAYDNAVKLLGDSINAALKNPSLDAGTRAALEGLLGEIGGNKKKSQLALKGRQLSLPPSNNPLYDPEIHTSDSIKKIVMQNGYSVNEFVSMLDADQYLSLQELKRIDQVSKKIGIPDKGTVMHKVIPASSIDAILSGLITGVQNCVTVKEHVANLQTLKEKYFGLRLDYIYTRFKLTDKIYGIIEYTINDGDETGIPYYAANSDNYPYTSRGFIGTGKVIVPEYMQLKRGFKDGDMLLIVNSQDGSIKYQYVYDGTNNTWRIM